MYCKRFKVVKGNVFQATNNSMKPTKNLFTVVKGNVFQATNNWCIWSNVLNPVVKGNVFQATNNSIEGINSTFVLSKVMFFKQLTTI